MRKIGQSEYFPVKNKVTFVNPGEEKVLLSF